MAPSLPLLSCESSVSEKKKKKKLIEKKNKIHDKYVLIILAIHFSTNNQLRECSDIIPGFWIHFQGHIQTSVDCFQPLWVPKKTPNFPHVQKKYSRLVKVEEGTIFIETSRSLLKSTKIHCHPMYYCYFEYF